MSAKAMVQWMAVVALGIAPCAAFAQEDDDAAPSVVIDGRIGADEWSGARRVDDFRITQPQSGAPATYTTEAWILSTPEGLAVAIRNTQPLDVPRNHQRVQRDFEDQVDRVNVMVDFDGDGRTGYTFTVSSTDGIADGLVGNETFFGTDWDGNWRHAVSEDDGGWSVEILIPWHIAPMHKATGGKRTIGIYLDRVLGSSGERAAWPAASFEKPRFLSDFARIEVRDYGQSLLAVTPYASMLYDNVNHRGDSNVGADLFWKPNGQFQLSATLNPDFSQVESDDLIVNFGAEETYYEDKRPFFTENQGLFDFATPSDDSQLLYTRRIGALADGGDSAAQIDAAVKLNGSFGATKYGVFAADEDGEYGRSFDALRVVRDFSDQNLGAMWVHSERPYYDRTSDVVGIDHDWRPNPNWSVHTRLIGSSVDEAGVTTRGDGATLWVDDVLGGGWRQQWIAMHFGDTLQINDAGYLSENDLNYLHWEFRRRFDELPADSRYASKEWRWRGYYVGDDHGDLLDDGVRIIRSSRLRDGSTEMLQLQLQSDGHDSTLLRGNGIVEVPGNVQLSTEFVRPREGDWAFDLEPWLFSSGLSDYHRVGYGGTFTASYFVNDAFSVTPGLERDFTPDWLLWDHDNLIGNYAWHMTTLTLSADWAIGPKQELRLKVQAVAVDAELRQGYRVQWSERVPTDEALDDDSVRNLGIQLRYRYEVAPLSYLYVVYARGGYLEEPMAASTTDLLHKSFSLRDDEQLMVKFSYRFEL